MSNKRIGRPPSKDPRMVRVELKLTVTEMQRLNDCCVKTGRSRASVLREGIIEVHDRLFSESK